MCSDPKRVWYPYRKVCYPSMEEAAAQRLYGEIHKARPYHDGSFSRWSEKATASTPYHYLDGVHIGVAETDLSPDDDFLTAPDPFGERASGNDEDT